VLESVTGPKDHDSILTLPQGFLAKTGFSNTLVKCKECGLIDLSARKSEI
jgi:ssDNA-binding Zn-finger/Zn-ribbon topoisomerase 1